MGYRALRQASTKHSPYYMLYQQHMKLPIDAEILYHENCEGMELEEGTELEEGMELDEVIDVLLHSRESFLKQILFMYKTQKDCKHLP